MNILFICTGNTCRSPMAEGIFRQKSVEKKLNGYNCGSAGLFAETGSPAAHNAVEACAELGIDISKHSSRLLNNTLLQNSDLLVVMTEEHAALLKNAGFQHDKIYILGGGIPDPYGRDINIYRICRDSIAAGIDQLLDNLESERQS